jgi:hypothetical protein
MPMPKTRGPFGRPPMLETEPPTARAAGPHLPATLASRPVTPAPAVGPAWKRPLAALTPALATSFAPA